MKRSAILCLALSLATAVPVRGDTIDVSPVLETMFSLGESAETIERVMRDAFDLKDDGWMTLPMNDMRKNDPLDSAFRVHFTNIKGQVGGAGHMRCERIGTATRDYLRSRPRPTMEMLSVTYEALVSDDALDNWPTGALASVFCAWSGNATGPDGGLIELALAADWLRDNFDLVEGVDRPIPVKNAGMEVTVNMRATGARLDGDVMLYSVSIWGDEKIVQQMNVQAYIFGGTS